MMKANNKMTKGEAIRYMRTTAGLTQKELAEKIGLKESTISIYELEKNNFPMNSFQKIANACDFEITIHDKDSDEKINIIIEKK